MGAREAPFESDPFLIQLFERIINNHVRYLYAMHTFPLILSQIQYRTQRSERRALASLYQCTQRILWPEYTHTHTHTSDAKNDKL